jgi:hypothetical protein
MPKERTVHFSQIKKDLKDMGISWEGVKSRGVLKLILLGEGGDLRKFYRIAT